MRPASIALIIVLTALAGCMDEPPTPDVQAPTLPDFDGGAAYAWVEDIVYVDDGSLRPRHPQASGHGDTVNWLWDRLATGDWQVTLDTFSGNDYDALEKGGVERYMSEPYCEEPDRSELEDLSFTNLYATLPGDGTGDGHVVLAAHWDAKEDASDGEGPVPAANDGASGLAVLLQLQRHVMDNDLSFPFDLTVAFFDGEDGFEDCHPLAGSLWAARNGSLGDISQLVLLDMVGDADARFILEGQSTKSDPALMQAIWDNASRTDFADNFVAARHTMQDDHVPFIEEGIPAIDIIDAGRSGYFPPYWHTSEDTPDKLSADMLGNIGGLMVWLLTDPGAQALLTD